MSVGTCMIRIAGCLVLTGVVLCGCYKHKVLVKVNKDGSGSIVITKVYSRESVDMVNSQIMAMGKYKRMYSGAVKQGGADRDPFFDEKAIKKQARLFGPSVKYVKAGQFNSSGARGYVAVYSFKDINEVIINMQKFGEGAASGLQRMMSYDEDDSEDPDGGDSARSREGMIEFKFARGTPDKLQVIMPTMPDMTGMEEMFSGADADGDAEEDDKEKKDGDEEDDEYGVAQEYTEQMMSSMIQYGLTMPAAFGGMRNESDALRKTFKGMQVSVAVEVDGEVAKTTASHIDAANKNRIILLELDAEKIAASPKGAKMFSKMGRYGMHNPAVMAGLMNKTPGASMETNKVSFVELK